MPAEMNLEHIEIPPNNALSDLDKAYVFLNYPFLTTSSPNKQWTIEHALDAAGVKDNLASGHSTNRLEGRKDGVCALVFEREGAAIARKIWAKRLLRLLLLCLPQLTLPM